MNSTMMQMKGRKAHCRQDYDDHPDHVAITERLRKTLYFGKTPQLDRPSLPLTELAVEFCQDAAQRELGKVDNYVAASMGRRACMSPCSMVLGLLYIERLKKKNPNYLRKVTSSDLFFISMMMASKYVYDEGVDEEVFNDEWAESARMEVDDVNDLEMDFLSAMDWGLFVKPEDFQTALYSIEKRIALRQGVDRNWFSYTDLWVLLQDPRYGHLWQETRTELGKIFLACSLAYIASVLTIVGSVIALSYASAGITVVTPVLLPLVTITSRQISVEPKSPDILPVQDHLHEMKLVSESGNHTVNNSLSTPEEPEHSVGKGAWATGHTSSENRDKFADRLTFPSVLPPLLAVMTLKNTLVKFVSAVSSSRGDNPIADELSPLACQTGLCSAELSNRCWNVSDFRHKDVSFAVRASSRHCQQHESTNQNCLRRFPKQNNLDSKSNGLRSRQFVSASNVARSVNDGRTSGSHQNHCCCRAKVNGLDSLSVQRDFVPDISLGFQTRTFAPLVANT